MIRSPRRSAGRSRIALAALVTAGGLVLAGCAAGQQAQTARELPSIDGANAEIGPIAVRNAALEYPTGGVYPKGGTARLRLVLVNTGNSPDTLVEVRTDAASGARFVAGGGASPSATASAAPTPSGTPSGTASGTPSGTASGSASGTATAAPIPSETAAPVPSETQAPGPTNIALAPNTAVRIGGVASGTAIELTGLTAELRPSQVISVTFVFSGAGSVTVQLPVGISLEEVSPAPTIEGGGEEG